ncbi:hypothetical protein [Burkholderia lata]|uniref:Transposase n=1 Tax=Burkholderia lata (strain ATCC 17760 / DSM 23089 / LMG 22485 / NCIMB 9086 / R18194 / 383) TaxID=482957 RepID=A0A6P2HKG9_BURL3|nr:transposase [Burkholderia lata]
MANTVGLLHKLRRKIIMAPGHFPSGVATLKPTWLALHSVVVKWTGARQDWNSAMTWFALSYLARFHLGI